MTASDALELELSVLLADLQQREDELRHRVELSHRTFFVFLAVLAGSIAAFLAVSSGVLDWLTTSGVRVGWLALAAAVMSLWFPLNTVHQEVQIKVRELYLERELLPRIRDVLRRARRRASQRGPGKVAGVLRWPAFERQVNTRRFTVMTVIRAAIVFLPSMVLVASWLLATWPLADHDTWIGETVVAALVVVVTLYCAWQAVGIVVERRFRQV